MGVASVPAVLSIASGVLLLAIVPLIWRYRGDVPVHRMLVLVILAAAAWSLSYGAALTVFDPELRRLMEIPIWLSRVLLTAAVFVGGLRYTGHDEVVPRWFTGSVLSMLAMSWLLHVTNALGFHALVWSDYAVTPVWGAAAVDYTPGLLLLAGVVAAYVIFGVVLFAAVAPGLHYGWLNTVYRSHFGVILAASVPPAAANFLWFVDLWEGAPTMPYSGLDLTPPAFLLSGVVLVSMVALRGDDIVEVTPADRRKADEAVVADLDTGVVAIDEDLRVVRINEAAAEVLDIERRNAFGRRLDSLSDVDVRPPFPDPETVSFPSQPSLTYELSSSEIEGDASNGYVVTLTDVTRRQRRRQRLEVLNRVLRHNLSNDVMVVEGNAEAVKDAVERRAEVNGELESEVRDHVETIFDKTGQLMREADRAREVADALPGEGDEHLVDVEKQLSEVVEDVSDGFPEAEVEVDVEDGLIVTTRPDLFRIAVENLVDNALRHAGDGPRVDVVAEGSDDAATNGRGVRLSVVDDGPGIPAQETEVLERGSESDTAHGSGIGLWTVAWCVKDLGGSLEFDVDDGTRVTVTVPDLDLR